MQLRAALEDQDPALIQDALYDAEEYLRAEIAAHADKSEADVLELIASTYGAPEEVAAAYRDTEIKVAAALRAPPKPRASSAFGRFFGIFSDARAYAGLLFMLFSLATGILYFTVTVVGISLSLGLAMLIIGVPFFIAFIGVTRVLALVECRLVETVSGVRMPRRPQHPGAPQKFLDRVVEHAHRYAHLDDARLQRADAAGGNCVFHARARRRDGQPCVHRGSRARKRSTRSAGSIRIPRSAAAE